MRHYKNLSGDSGVTAYESGPGWIKIRFNNGTVYLYSDASAGVDNIAQMQCLAEAGRGLSTYIAQKVHEGFAKRLL
jgi:hypothetical protein